MTLSGITKTVRSGQLGYNSIKDEAPVIRLHGHTAIVTGRVDIECQWEGQVALERLLYTAVYGWSAPRWRMLEWQSTPRADAAG